MSNSILDLVNRTRNSASTQPMQTNPQIQQIKNMMNFVQRSPNPQLALQNLMMQNSNFKNILNTIQMSGSNPQQFAQMLAQQKGVDLNALIQELQR